MRRGVAIDPGKRRAGVTIFDVEQREVLRAGLVTVDGEDEGPRAVIALAQRIVDWVGMPVFDTLAVEWPRTYEGRASRGDANDLFYLSGLDCALAMRTRNVVHYLPQEWGALGKPKAAKEKYAVEHRVFERLSSVEQLRIEWPKNRRYSWDVTDSLAIALKFMGRFERARAFARD